MTEPTQPPLHTYDIVVRLSSGRDHSMKVDAVNATVAGFYAQREVSDKSLGTIRKFVKIEQRKA